MPGLPFYRTHDVLEPVDDAYTLLKEEHTCTGSGDVTNESDDEEPKHTCTQEANDEAVTNSGFTTGNEDRASPRPEADDHVTASSGLDQPIDVAEHPDSKAMNYSTTSDVETSANTKHFTNARLTRYCNTSKMLMLYST